MTIREKTQELTEEIKKLREIEHDPEKTSKERLDARIEADKKWLEVNDLLMKKVDSDG
jgi:hypothetical protein